MAAGVFVNYRRGDRGGYVRRLYQWLRGHFGDQLFKDTESIRAGDDFAVELQAALGSSAVLLAVMGADWAELTDDGGRRRLDDPQDWVRTEIAEALGSGVPVIPVLLPGASMPPLGRLPDDLRALAGRSPVQLHDDTWADDVENLIARLEELGVRQQLIPIGPTTAGRLSPVMALRGHSGGVNDVAFSPDGRRVVTAGGLPNWMAVNRLDYLSADRREYQEKRAALADRTVRLWRVADGSVVHTLGPHAGLLTAVAIAPSGSLLAVGDGRTVRLWDPETGADLAEAPIPGRALAFSADGTLLAMGCADGAVLVFRTTDRELLYTAARHRKPVISLAFSPSGEILASGSQDGTVRLWRAPDWGRLTVVRAAWRLDGTVSGSPTAVRGVAFAPDGTTLAAACRNGQVRRWRVPSGRPVRPSLQVRTGSATSVAYSPDGSLLAAGSSNGELWLWPAAGGEPTLVRTENDEIRALAFAADGCTLATAVWNKTAYLWRVAPQPGGQP
jgi:WD40 repeat protein